ncbi:hypothetical protein DWS70_10125 [Escherichia coli]|nr:hypothetical protein [Escherichia coli]
MRTGLVSRTGCRSASGDIFVWRGKCLRVAGMCKSMMMLIRRLTSVAIRFDAWEETRVQR